jgi:hypothetical protein
VILRALKEGQPFNTSGATVVNCDENPLWRLHRLDIIDSIASCVVRAALDVGGVWWD